MSKKNGVTLRQRLRADADKQLQNIIRRTSDAISSVAADCGLAVPDLAKLCTEGDHKTLRNEAVTYLANVKERELEKLYNKQMDLIQEDEKRA